MAAWRYEISLFVFTLEEKFRISARSCNIQDYQFQSDPRLSLLEKSMEGQNALAPTLCFAQVSRYKRLKRA